MTTATIKSAMARHGQDMVHFSTGEIGDKTLCGRSTDAEGWEALDNYEVEDALSWCGNCQNTNAWNATFPPEGQRKEDSDG